MDKRSAILRDEYQARFEANATYRDSVWRLICSNIFTRYVRPHDTVLDLGAGWGEFSRNIVADKKYAMDLNPDCGERLQGVAQFLFQDCSVAWPLADGILDIVFTSNFLEHLPGKDQIDKTLAEAYRCLKPGGLMLCIGPNIRYLPGLYWDYWDHHVPITDGSIAEALNLQGFKIKKRMAKFLPYTMSGGRNPPLSAVRLYLRSPIFWPLFGKQFFVVGQK